MKQATYRKVGVTVPATAMPRPAMSVCMHALVPARQDVRAMRTATALAQAGFAVSIIDIEHDQVRPCQEDLSGVHIKHIRLPSRFSRYYHPTSFIPWLLFKAMRMFYGVLTLLRTSADVYHACYLTALPATYIAARLR